jgi:FkbM family methyltransferase
MSDLPLARFRRTGELAQRAAVIRRAPRSVRGAARFAVNELLTGATAGYALRRGELELMLRHASSDTWVFREVFVDGLYEQALSLVAGEPSPKIVDLGAHVGMFSLRAAATCPGVRIVAVEPDPLNLRVLREVFARNADRSREWALVEACAATEDGAATLVEDGSYVSHVDGVGHPPPGFEARVERVLVEVPAVDVFPLIDGADLVKMDIEGSEWRILESPRLRDARVRNLFLEYHGWACAEAEPRTRAVELLEQAGLRMIGAPPAEQHQGVLLATRDAG